MYFCELCLSHYAAEQIKNCMKRASVIKVATMKIQMESRIPDAGLKVEAFLNTTLKYYLNCIVLVKISCKLQYKTIEWWGSMESTGFLDHASCSYIRIKVMYLVL